MSGRQLSPPYTPRHPFKPNNHFTNGNDSLCSPGDRYSNSGDNYTTPGDLSFNNDYYNLADPLSTSGDSLATLDPLTTPLDPLATPLDPLQHLTDQLRSVLDFSRLPPLEEPLSPPASPPLMGAPLLPSLPRLPLFSRCPYTNQAQLWGLQEPPRAPLGLPSFREHAHAPGRPWNSSPPSPPAASSKPSLDTILCTSLVALTNKQREGKYWFKSGCPTPDPRWPAGQQLMVGPIPGDCDYAELRTAFLSHGQTCHLFIQNNQAWLERNQEKFGPRQVKFGYVVYSDAEAAEALYRQGSVLVRRASGQRIQVRVKRMDGLPAQFNRN